MRFSLITKKKKTTDKTKQNKPQKQQQKQTNEQQKNKNPNLLDCSCPKIFFKVLSHTGAYTEL